MDPPHVIWLCVLQQIDLTCNLALISSAVLENKFENNGYNPVEQTGFSQLIYFLTAFPTLKHRRPNLTVSNSRSRSTYDYHLNKLLLVRDPCATYHAGFKT